MYTQALVLINISFQSLQIYRKVLIINQKRWKIPRFAWFTVVLIHIVGALVTQWVRSLDLTTHGSLSPIRRGFVPCFVNYKRVHSTRSSRKWLVRGHIVLPLSVRPCIRVSMHPCACASVRSSVTLSMHSLSG